jgi:hypothetical protein
MNALFEPAHSRFGGSNAGRILHCPKSVQLVDKVHAHLHKISVYAEHGTALHTAITLLLDKKESFESLAGKDDRQLPSHGRRYRNRVAADPRLCGAAPRHPRR